MMAVFAGLALHTWTLDTTPLDVALDAAARGGFDAVELRRSDFTGCFARGMSNDDVLDLVRACGLKVCCLGVEYGWMFAEGDERRRLFEVFEASCANAVALGAPLVMSAPGQVTGTIDRAGENTRTAGRIAADHGLRLAIEFNSTHPLVNGAGVVREIAARSGADNVGVLLDAYHLTRLGRGGRGFEEVPGEEIFYFQYSDVPARAPSGDKRPTDRLLPGRGTVDWAAMLGLLAEKGYRGYLSFEAPNPEIWARPPHEVAADAVKASRAILAGL